MAASRSLNKVMLIGNLSRDPVIRTTPNGATVCTYGIATNTAWKDESGELQERTEFHNVVSWNKLAEICAQILAVGMLVYVEGEIRTRSWDDENGVRHYRSEVRISDMKLLDSKGKRGIGIENATAKADKKVIKEDKSDKKSTGVRASSSISSSSIDKDENSKKGRDEEEKVKKEKVEPEDMPF